MSIQVWQKEDRAGSFNTCVHASIHVYVLLFYLQSCIASSGYLSLWHFLIIIIKFNAFGQNTLKAETC